MPALYELTNYWRVIKNQLDEAEDDKTFLACLDAVESEIEDKADNYGCIIKEYEALAKAIKEEEERFAARRKTALNKADSLRKRLRDELIKIDKKSFTTSKFNFSVHKSGGQQAIKYKVAVDMLPDELKKVKYDYNSQAIRELIKAGDTRFGEFIPKEESLFIK